jgi:hypothetical protein
MMLFAVMHLLLGAVLVSSPFLANALVSNSSAVAGIVMPFVAAATAAGVATLKGGQAGGSVPSAGGGGNSGGGPKMAGQNTNYRTPTARAATAAFTSNNTAAPAAPAAPAPGANNAGGGAKIAANASTTSKLDSSASGGPGMGVYRKDLSAQNRRGAILAQQNKSTPPAGGATPTPPAPKPTTPGGTKA